MMQKHHHANGKKEGGAETINPCAVQRFSYLDVAFLNEMLQRETTAMVMGSAYKKLQ